MHISLLDNLRMSEESFQMDKEFQYDVRSNVKSFFPMCMRWPGMPISKEHVQAAKSKQIIKKVWFGDEAICCMKICTNTFFLFIWTRRLPRYYRNMWLQLWWFWRASIRFIQLKISTVPGFEPNQKSQTRLQPTLTANLDKIYYGEI